MLLSLRPRGRRRPRRTIRGSPDRGPGRTGRAPHRRRRMRPEPACRHDRRSRRRSPPAPHHHAGEHHLADRLVRVRVHEVVHGVPQARVELLDGLADDAGGPVVVRRPGGRTEAEVPLDHLRLVPRDGHARSEGLRHVGPSGRDDPHELRYTVGQDHDRRGLRTEVDDGDRPGDGPAGRQHPAQRERDEVDPDRLRPASCTARTLFRTASLTAAMSSPSRTGAPSCTPSLVG